MIRLPYAGRNAQFDEHDLTSHIAKSGREYIIQGQQNCSLAEQRWGFVVLVTRLILRLQLMSVEGTLLTY